MNQPPNAPPPPPPPAAAEGGGAEERRSRNSWEPIPRAAIFIFILILLFLLGFGISVFILAVVHSPLFFLSFLSLSSLVLAFLLWNSLCFRRKAALFFFLHSFPDSDLRFARDGQLVKFTGPVSCGNVALESSYEKVARCVYMSTVMYECRGPGWKALNAKALCFLWRLAYSESIPTDFYIFDKNSGMRALVKAGYGCKVIPLIVETRLVNTEGNRSLSSSLTKWLTDRNLSAESRLICLEEGYIKEGDFVTVIGMLRRGDYNIAMVVQPPEVITKGCLWQKLLLSVDFDGLILGISNVSEAPPPSASLTHPT